MMPMARCFSEIGYLGRGFEIFRRGVLGCCFLVCLMSWLIVALSSMVVIMG
jgi:hypothetical protein